MKAKAWQETVELPTYPHGEPCPHPMFLEKRVYQGSSGVVYPHPVIEKIYDDKVMKSYQAVFIENEWLKVMLLPELGGRVHYAYDKTIKYDFVYHNEVIKPALVGLAGPWISGGIEFNWPQHHRPSTFDPTDFRIENNEDGSATVWIGEIERMFRTKALVGFTLYPDKAFLELDVRLYNRTSEPQTFLWWANPAVAVNDDYQSVFPPDVHAVMDHGKRDVSDFPIATGTYYKVDYSPGTDISRYKNIPVPTSFMAYHSDFDFMGCYDHGQQAGMLHIANHHVVPGKKQWTWGHGNFGQVWDHQLTDKNGPYIELMCGAYTDNQPDFTWLMPGEEKRFKQHFMPYKKIGPVSNADRDTVLALDCNGHNVNIGVYLTGRDKVEIKLCLKERELYCETVELDPATPFTGSIRIDEDFNKSDLTLSVTSARRKLRFSPLPGEKNPIPDPATPAREPREIESNEELFLNGLHLEQYRHATYRPEPYYEEALRRDPGDSRCNNAMGLLRYRAADFEKAEEYFRKAVKRLTLRNPNPYDGEPSYNLGLALKMQGRFDEAFDAFYKAVWNDAWQSAAYFELARISAMRGDTEEALDLVERSLSKNTNHHKARHLKIILLRKAARHDECRAVISEALEKDPLEFGALYEQLLLEGSGLFKKLIRDYVHNYIELALDYVHAGFYDEAVSLLDEAPAIDAMTGYYRGWVYRLRGDEAQAKDAFRAAASTDTYLCFPHRIECVTALNAAMQLNPQDARAPYYLGNFLYAHRRYAEAIEQWEKSSKLDDGFATVWRNLGLAYMNKCSEPDKAMRALTKAFALAPDDARIFFELDQLHKKTGTKPAERLRNMSSNLKLVLERDDTTVEYIALLNIARRHDEALDILRRRNFHPWEGGEGKVAAQYVITLTELARADISAGNYDAAIEKLKAAESYPLNLGEGKLPGARDNNILYYLGCAYKGKGDAERAGHFFAEAAQGDTEPTSAMYYNDRPPEMIFYQGLAQQELGNDDKAGEIFNRLVSYGKAHLDDTIKMDYFAVSLPDFLVFDEDLNQQNRLHCLYMTGLGYLGLGKLDEAEILLGEVLKNAPSHLGAILHQRLLTTR